MKKILGKILISTVVVLNLNTSFSHAISIDELINEALENSPKIMESQLDIESKKVDLYDLKKQIDKADENDLDKVEKEILRIKYDYNQKIYEKYPKQILNLEKTNIKKKLYEYIYQNNLFNQNKKDLDQKKLDYELAKKKSNQGDISSLELASIEYNYQLAKLNYADSKNNLNKIREELNILLGKSIDMDIDISYDLDIIDIDLNEFDNDDIYAFNLENNIELLNLELSKILKEREYNSYIVTFSQASVEARNKKIAMTKSHIEYENYKNTLKSDISYELKSLMNEKENINIKINEFNLKELEYNLAKKQYEKGQISLIDLNNKYHAYSISKYDYEKAIFDYNMNLLDFIRNYNIDSI
ncbi:MAG: TolC family protein [Peptostreptococcaceae bacterium]|jgi:outer membrane protein TolC|nr:TolC family protein [Peptostreptococcaceae bacterium]